MAAIPGDQRADEGGDGRKEEIARAALAVVARSGARGATLRDIAREAGYTTGVIGYYFDGRDDLIAHVHRYAHDRIGGTAGEPGQLDQLLDAWTVGGDVERAAFLLWIDWVLSDRSVGAVEDAVREILDQRRELAREALGDALTGAPLELAVDGLLAVTEGLALHALVDGVGADPAERRALVERVLP